MGVAPEMQCEIAKSGAMEVHQKRKRIGNDEEDIPNNANHIRLTSAPDVGRESNNATKTVSYKRRRQVWTGENKEETIKTLICNASGGAAASCDEIALFTRMTKRRKAVADGNKRRGEISRQSTLQRSGQHDEHIKSDSQSEGQGKRCDLKGRATQQLCKPLPRRLALRLAWPMSQMSEEDVVAQPNGCDITKATARTLFYYGQDPDNTNRPVGWVSDSIIDCWLVTLREARRRRDKTTGPLLTAMSCWWFKKTDDSELERWAKRLGIAGSDLLSCEKLFLPMNEGGSHWSLLVISPTKRNIEWLDSLGDGSGKHKIAKRAHRLLKVVLKNLYVEEEWTFLTTQSCQQENSKDCGVFVCLNALAIARGMPIGTVGEQDVETAREFIMGVLLNGGFDGEFALEF